MQTYSEYINSFKSNLNEEKEYNIHDDPEYFEQSPKKFSPSDREAIKHYRETKSESQNGHRSSGNMNSVLRNCAGDHDQHVIGGHHAEHVFGAIKKMSGIFKKSTTNKKEMSTYAGVNSRAGKQLSGMKKGDKFSIAGFQSASTNRDVADGFAREGLMRRTSDDSHVHVVHYHHAPHSVASIKPKNDEAKHAGEDEGVMVHGTHGEYHGSEEVEPTDRDKAFGVTKKTVHHVYVHSPLEEVGGHSTKLEQYPHPHIDSQGWKHHIDGKIEPPEHLKKHYESIIS